MPIPTEHGPFFIQMAAVDRGGNTGSSRNGDFTLTCAQALDRLGNGQQRR